MYGEGREEWRLANSTANSTEATIWVSSFVHFITMPALEPTRPRHPIIDFAQFEAWDWFHLGWLRTAFTFWYQLVSFHLPPSNHHALFAQLFHCANLNPASLRSSCVTVPTSRRISMVARPDCEMLHLEFRHAGHYAIRYRPCEERLQA